MQSCKQLGAWYLEVELHMDQLFKIKYLKKYLGIS